MQGMYSKTLVPPQFIAQPIYLVPIEQSSPRLTVTPFILWNKVQSIFGKTHKPHETPVVVSGVGDSNNRIEKHRSADAGRAWPSDVAAPPPYMSVAPETRVEQTTPSTALAGSSSSSPRVTLASPGSCSTRISIIHPAFASHERVKDIAYLQAPMLRELQGDALKMLRKYDTVIVVDDTASMLKKHLWEQACNALSEPAETAG